MMIHTLPAKKISYGEKRPLKEVKYIVIHYTGNRGDTARGNASYFHSVNTRKAGAHLFVDQRGRIYKSVKLSRIAWAVGGKKYQNCKTTGGGKYYGICTNKNSVSIEMCDMYKNVASPQMIRGLKDAVKYVRKYCPNARIIIRHFDVNGKNCPGTMAIKESKEWRRLLSQISSIF